MPSTWEQTLAVSKRDRRNPLIWCVAVYLFAFGCSGAGTERSGTAAEGPEITTFQQLNKLPRMEALKGRTVRLNGVVLCNDMSEGQLYLHDGTETVHLKPEPFQAELQPGQYVELNGRTTVAEGHSALTN